MPDRSAQAASAFKGGQAEPSVEKTAPRACADLADRPRASVAVELDHLPIREPGSDPVAVDRDLLDDGLFERPPKRRARRPAAASEKAPWRG
jgi:hypothetical protein